MTNTPPTFDDLATLIMNNIGDSNASMQDTWDAISMLAGAVKVLHERQSAMVQDRGAEPQDGHIRIDIIPLG